MFRDEQDGNQQAPPSNGRFQKNKGNFKGKFNHKRTYSEEEVQMILDDQFANNVKKTVAACRKRERAVDQDVDEEDHNFDKIQIDDEDIENANLFLPVFSL